MTVSASVFFSQARDVENEDLVAGISVLVSTTKDEGSISELRIEQGESTAERQANLDAILFIPGEIIERIPASSERFVATSYISASLFQDEKLIESNANRTEFSRNVNSRIISGSIGDTVLENLDVPVQIVFRQILLVGKGRLALYCPNLAKGSK